MVDGALFDKLAAIGQKLRKNPKFPGNKDVPFGGIQVVLTGDFFQLPPVSRGMATFAFEAKAWKSSIDYTVNLTQVFRQKDTSAFRCPFSKEAYLLTIGKAFVDMLNEMRHGRLSAQSISKFHSLSRPIVYQDGIEPTEL
jgi:ATP-dependent DNA helicase PIF1